MYQPKNNGGGGFMNRRGRRPGGGGVGYKTAGGLSVADLKAMTANRLNSEVGASGVPGHLPPAQTGAALGGFYSGHTAASPQMPHSSHMQTHLSHQPSAQVNNAVSAGPQDIHESSQLQLQQGQKSADIMDYINLHKQEQQSKRAQKKQHKLYKQQQQQMHRDSQYYNVQHQQTYGSPYVLPQPQLNEDGFPSYNDSSLAVEMTSDSGSTGSGSTNSGTSSMHSNSRLGCSGMHMSMPTDFPYGGGYGVDVSNNPALDAYRNTGGGSASDLSTYASAFVSGWQYRNMPPADSSHQHQPQQHHYQQQDCKEPASNRVERDAEMSSLRAGINSTALDLDSLLVQQSGQMSNMKEVSPGMGNLMRTERDLSRESSFVGEGSLTSNSTDNNDTSLSSGPVDVPSLPLGLLNKDLEPSMLSLDQAGSGTTTSSAEDFSVFTNTQSTTYDTSNRSRSSDGGMGLIEEGIVGLLSSPPASPRLLDLGSIREATNLPLGVDAEGLVAMPGQNLESTANASLTGLTPRSANGDERSVENQSSVGNAVTNITTTAHRRRSSHNSTGSNNSHSRSGSINSVSSLLIATTQSPTNEMYPGAGKQSPSVVPELVSAFFPAVVGSGGEDSCDGDVHEMYKDNA